MNRPLKKYVEKFEALDVAAGIYQSRTLKRERYNQNDFLEYLSAYELLGAEPDFRLEPDSEMEFKTLE
ncbi:hypothetical protein [Vampirovibrio sp.]|uniref:hypothetical protein n=1 Tax=Vampirovibrio sp. TaxID=2717857 RepID=UPI0035938A43